MALAWALAQPGITSLILGASKPEQLQGNLASLEIEFTPEQLGALDRASALPPSTPSSILMPGVSRMIFGGATIEGWK